MKQKIRIVLTGAQSTGKTTLANELAKKYNINSLSICREQATEQNWTPNTPGSVEYQKSLFDKLQKAISSKKSYVSDRALSCVAAYTFKHAMNDMNDKQLKKLAETQYKKFCTFHNNNDDVLIVYTPIEFETVDDGFRNVDEQDRAFVDYLIKNILDTTGAEYLTVTGTVEERIKQIEQALNI